MGEAGRPGPSLRTDLVVVLIFRRTAGDAGPDVAARTELLQLRRIDGPMAGTFQPVLGHIEPGETAEQAARRETLEETGLDIAALRTDAFALDRPCVFFWPPAEAVFLAPAFAFEAPPAWEPRLEPPPAGEHDASRWARADDEQGRFMWPGHREAVDELLSLLGPGSLSAPHQRLRPPR